MIRLRSSSYGATSPLNHPAGFVGLELYDEESVARVAAELLDEAVFPIEIGLHRAFLDIGALIGTTIAM